ncbi:hypothetical protein BRADI_2g51075v3 [Brachypodium distachyon]|uniref:Uncharacterized protein n=1 Tax=Brachypodium distachyon TaxID=15368 RepID=A0A2K2DF55_BRADI|nr:hypothetical protein BRADI_2g51075v3 [Brachypodium distachyon]
MAKDQRRGQIFVRCLRVNLTRLEEKCKQRTGAVQNYRN